MEQRLGSLKGADAYPRMRWYQRVVTKREIAAYPTTDYWEIFVLKHRHPGNLAFHWISCVMFYGNPIVAFVTWNAWWLLLFPLSSLVGVMGHYLFEQSNVDLRDAVFSRQTMRCLNRMFIRILTGRYRQDIELASAKLCAYRANSENSGTPQFRAPPWVLGSRASANRGRCWSRLMVCKASIPLGTQRKSGERAQP